MVLSSLLKSVTIAHDRTGRRGTGSGSGGGPRPNHPPRVLLLTRMPTPTEQPRESQHGACRYCGSGLGSFVRSFVAASAVPVEV